MATTSSVFEVGQQVIRRSGGVYRQPERVVVVTRVMRAFVEVEGGEKFSPDGHHSYPRQRGFSNHKSIRAALPEELEAVREKLVAFKLAERFHREDWEVFPAAVLRAVDLVVKSAVFSALESGDESFYDGAELSANGRRLCGIYGFRVVVDSSGRREVLSRVAEKSGQTG